jgi:type I restriction enzyme R subunit
MPHPYTEDQLVEQPAIGPFAELGWETVCAMEETFGCAESSPPAPLPCCAPSPLPSPQRRGVHQRGGSPVSLGRETTGEVVLLTRLRAALARLNTALPLEPVIYESRGWSYNPV